MQGNRPDTSASPPPAAFSYERWREDFLRIVLIGATIFGLAATVASSLDVIRSGNPVLAFVYCGAWLVLFVITLRPWPYPVRMGTLLALIYALGVSGLLENGMRGDARLFFLGLTIMSAMLVGVRGAIVASAASLLTIAAVGSLALTGVVRLMSRTTTVGPVQLWLVSTLDLALLQTVALTGLSLFLKEFTAAHAQLAQSVATLGRERTLLRTVIDNVPDAIYAKDADGRRQLANRADARMLGLTRAEEALGKTGAETLPDDEAARLLAEDREILRTGRSVINREVSHPADDGRTRWLLVSKLPLHSPSGEITGMVGIDRDITESREAEQQRMRLEEQLRLSQRMEAMGRLAGGLAHDINNLLTPILGYSGLLLAEPTTEAGLVESLKQIRGAAERARDLSRQLLAFGRRQALRLQIVDLRDVVRSCAGLLRRTLREDVQLVLLLPPDLGTVEADAGAIEQVLMNLLLNAQDAMPTGGKLSIELRDRTLGEAECRVHPGLAPGRHEEILVSDTGVGMDPSILSRVFDPFFTTKPGGTGLGLSSVYGLVQQHRGDVTVDSHPGAGTTFSILLPRVEPRAQTAETAPALEEDPDLRGTGTVLVVEDTDAVLEIVVRVLTRLGYRVLTARTAEEALRISPAADARVDLLLADVIMPGMDGAELARRMRAERPDLRVLFMSGYTRETLEHHGVVEGSVSVLRKPFDLRELALQVHRALEARATG